MPFLMHIAVDNQRRLPRRIHYFEYDGVRFKLIQNSPRKWSDVLLALLPDRQAATLQRAYGAAGEFLSALAWHLDTRIIMRPSGGIGVPSGYRLRQAKCRMLEMPALPSLGSPGGSLLRIARVQSPDQRLALTLHREAMSANKVHLQVLLLWQVLEVAGNDAVGWANRVQRSRPPSLGLRPDELAVTEGRRLGDYLQEDCRHAIAHIRREKGRRALRFDDLEEERRLHRTAELLDRLARHYIRTDLDVTEECRLVRRTAHGVPQYIPQSEIGSGRFYRAYPR